MWDSSGGNESIILCVCIFVSVFVKTRGTWLVVHVLLANANGHIMMNWLHDFSQG